MKYYREKMILLLLILALFVSCGKGEDNGPVSIYGVLYDSSSSGPAVAGATVTLRNTSNMTLSTSITGTDGSYTLTNVPNSTDLYINVSKTGYASCNTEILNQHSSSYQPLFIRSALFVKAEADKFYGSIGGTSWTDSFYASKSWFSMDIAGLYYIFLWPGVTVSPSPPDVTVVYNNGFDFYSTTGPTSGTPGTFPQVGGYGFTSGIYTFTLTLDSSTSTIRLPLVPGEMSYSAKWLL